MAGKTDVGITKLTLSKRTPEEVCRSKRAFGSEISCAKLCLPNQELYWCKVCNYWHQTMKSVPEAGKKKE